jgi:hypothetical protein
MTISDPESTMVCGESNKLENAVTSLSAGVAFAAAMASRRLQSESHVPSFVSAVLVTINVAAEAVQTRKQRAKKQDKSLTDRTIDSSSEL